MSWRDVAGAWVQALGRPATVGLLLALVVAFVVTVRAVL